MPRSPRHLRALDDRGEDVSLSPKAERGPRKLSSAAIVTATIIVGGTVGVVFLGLALVWFILPWAGLVLLAEYQYLGPKRVANEAIKNCLQERRCPACLYSLSDLIPESDGCVVCPECGAAWRLTGVPALGPTVP
jgi:hypothetical protein